MYKAAEGPSLNYREKGCRAGETARQASEEEQSNRLCAPVRDPVGAYPEESMLKSVVQRVYIQSNVAGLDWDAQE